MELLALRKVLVAIDLEDGSSAAWKSARDLAAAAGSELHALHVMGSNVQVASAEAELKRIGVSRAVAEVHLSSGDPAHAIGLSADRLGVDVIVLGPHRERQGGERASGLGSTALAVVTNAAVPCLVTSTPLRLPLAHVVVAVELSDNARGTLLVALSWASALRSREAAPTQLTSLHVIETRSSVQDEARARAVDEALSPIRHAAGEWAGVALRSETIRADNAADGIKAHTKVHPAELVTLGTRGLGVEPIGRLGSTSVEVMRQIDAPILLVPPAMWKQRRDALAS